jgi:hypothetical protein
MALAPDTYQVTSGRPLGRAIVCKTAGSGLQGLPHQCADGLVADHATIRALSIPLVWLLALGHVAEPFVQGTGTRVVLLDGQLSCGVPAGDDALFRDTDQQSADPTGLQDRMHRSLTQRASASLAAVVDFHLANRRARWQTRRQILDLSRLHPAELLAYRYQVSRRAGPAEHGDITSVQIPHGHDHRKLVHERETTDAIASARTCPKLLGDAPESPVLAMPRKTTRARR